LGAVQCATVNTSSFVGSTLDVLDADFFDFGNGIDSSVNFAGTSVAAITSLGGTIATDGTLFFASQALDLQGTFDAGTGRAAFVAASDVNVQFNPGSPLGYTIAAGTTVASQNVSGTVTGAGADFQMVSAAGVVGALLQVDANVTATTATPTETGILLQASGLGAAQPTIVTNGVLDSSGVLEVSSGADYTANAALTGASVDIDAVGTVTASSITSTGGDVNINAVSLTGASVNIDSMGTVTAPTITSTSGDIDVNSVGVARIDGYNSAGTVSVTSTTGDVLITTDSTSVGAATLSSVTSSVFATTTGTLAGPGVSLSTTDPRADLDIDAGFFIKAGDLASGGDIMTDSGRDTTLGTQTSAGSITANSARTYASGLMTTTGAGGAIDVTAVRGATVAGYDSSDSVSIRATGTGGDVDITANSTSSGSASLISARGNVFATSTGTVGGAAVNLTTTGTASNLVIDADQRIKTGNLTSGRSITTASGSTTLVGTQTAIAGSITGNVTGATATYVSDLITATNGVVSITAASGNLDLDLASSTIGVISAPGNISIDSNQSLLLTDSVSSTGANDVRIVSAGNLTINPAAQITGGIVALSASGDFINNRGADAISAADHWVVYSDAPTDNVFGNLDSGNTAIWNGSIANLDPASVTDNRYVSDFISGCSGKC